MSNPAVPGWEFPPGVYFAFLSKTPGGRAVSEELGRDSWGLIETSADCGASGALGETRQGDVEQLRGLGNEPGAGAGARGEPRSWGMGFCGAAQSRSPARPRRGSVPSQRSRQGPLIPREQRPAWPDPTSRPWSPRDTGPAAKGGSGL